MGAEPGKNGSRSRLGVIDVCGWKGQSIGNAGVYERFGLQLEPEPVVV